MSWLGTWAKRKAIKYGVTKPGSSLTDFPLLIKIASDSDIGAILSSRKFAVTLANGTTTVPYESISYNESAGAVTANLQAKFSPQSSASTGDVLGYLYYDDTQSDTEDPTNVWDSNFKGVWHLEQDPSGSAPQILDSTSNNNDGTSTGSMTSGDLMAAKVANGLELDSVNDTIDFGNSSTLRPANLTLDITFDSTIGYATLFKDYCYLALGSGGNPGGGFGGFALFVEAGVAKGTASTNAGIGATTATGGTVAGDTWYHLVMTFDGSTITLYLNGTSVGTASLSGSLDYFGTPSFVIGRAFGAYFGGIVDEVTLSSIARSADWIAYDYNAKFNNSNVITLGTEESISSGQTHACPIAQLTVSGITAATTKALALTAQQLTVSGVRPGSLHTTTVTPQQLHVNPVVSNTVHTLGIIPQQFTISVVTVGTTHRLALSPNQLTINPISPSTSKAVTAPRCTVEVDPITSFFGAIVVTCPIAQLTINPIAFGFTKRTTLIPDQITISGVQPATLKNTTAPRSSLTVAGITPLPQKIAALSPQQFTVSTVGLGSHKTASASGSITVSAVVPSTSKVTVAPFCVFYVQIISDRPEFSTRIIVNVQAPRLVIDVSDPTEQLVGS